MSTLVSESTRYIRYNDLTLNCKSDLIPLILSPVNYLVYAIKCNRQPDCTAFMFTQNTSSVQGAACSWCPANDTVRISYTSADLLLEIWAKTLGFLVFPNNPVIKEPVPTTLLIGRVLFFQGIVPDAVPDRCIFSLNVNSSSNIAARIEARFNFELRNRERHSRSDGQSSAIERDTLGLMDRAQQWRQTLSVSWTELSNGDRHSGSYALDLTNRDRHSRSHGQSSAIERDTLGLMDRAQQ
ncbi:hypothetical protein PoB_005842600 [Plakobranchus ocellatus]|uniref:Uncharacterized protein n=1 Tax=Plakobranchus ocellatus TaxID=259542 RepID=A0AAV4CK53_9GAST|nr:hypothetical protein PoB_005842600 [Plakobranchus ocellatus]